MNVVAPDYSPGGYTESGDFGGGSWGEDIPWQGSPEGAASSSANAGATQYTSNQGQQQQPQEQQPQQQPAYSGGGAAAGRSGAEWSTTDYWGAHHDAQCDGREPGDEGDYFIHPRRVDGNGMGLLSCTFGDAAARDMAAARDRVKPHVISLLPEFTAPAHVLSTLIPPALQTVPHMYVMVADSASTVNATGDGRFIYNRRVPAPAESSLVVGDGRSVSVECYGDLDVVFYSELRQPTCVTIHHMAVVPGLKFDLFSLNKVQERDPQHGPHGHVHP